MFKEIYQSIQNQLFKKTWFRVTCVVLLLLLLLILYLIWKTPNVEKGEIAQEERWENFQEELIDFRDAKDTSSDGVIFEEHDHTMDEGTSIEEAIEYFFFAVKANDVDLFGSAVMPEMMQADYFQYDVIERIDKMSESMSRITRNNQLERIEIVRNLWQFQKNTTRVVVDLFYTDLTEPIRVNFVMTSVEYSDTHFEGEDEVEEVYLVNTSIWELIRNIEGKAGE